MYEYYVRKVENVVDGDTIDVLIDLGFDISDPAGVTELEWIANKYPELTERCNKALLELIQKQAKATHVFVGVGYQNSDLYNF